MSNVTDRVLRLTTLAIKHPVRVATTADITLSGLQSIDGVTVTAGDRVLVKDQDDGTENGIYRAASGTWDRDQDFNDNSDIVQFTRIYVGAGTVNAGREYQISTASPSIGSTSLSFQLSGPYQGALSAQEAAEEAAAAAAQSVIDATLAAGGPVYNPYPRRAWAKGPAILMGIASERLNLVMFGDSVAGLLKELIDVRLKIEWVNGGIAGRLAGENGFNDDGNGTNISEVTSDFTTSPNGNYWNLASGGSKYWQVGNNGTPLLQPMATYHPQAFLAPNICTRVGIWYISRTGGGTFKVQTSTKQSPSSFSDVTGLTTIDTNGSLGVQYTQVTIASRDVSRIRIEHVSGSNCYILGGLVGADIGVYMHSWNVGGLALTAMVDSARFAELCATYTNASAGGADLVMTSFLDSPGDSSGSTGLTLTQLIDGILNDIRSAFPSSVVPFSVTPWAGKSPTLAAQAPDFAFFAGNKAQSSSIDQDAYNAAILNNALANGDCYVDVAGLWSSWQTAWDRGVMSEGDGSGSSTHPRIWFYGMVATEFLRRTGLIGGAFARPFPFQLIDKLQVGSGALGASNVANRAKVGTATSFFSAGPADFAGFGDIVAAIISDGSNLEAGMVFRNTGASGKTFLVTSQAAGVFAIRSLDNSENIDSYNPTTRQRSIAQNAGDTVAAGPKGMYSSGARHGVATLVAGVATISDATVTANARIVMTRRAQGGTPGVVYEAPAADIVAATSFKIRAFDASNVAATSDTSTVSWVIVEP